MPTEVAVVRRARFEKPLRCGDVGISVGTLKMWAFKVLIGVGDPDPGHRVNDALSPFGPVAGFVGVFDPQHERATKALRQRPVHQGCPRAADMEEAGRRGGESEARTGP